MVTLDNLVTGLNQYAVRQSKSINTLINDSLEWDEPSDFRPCDYSWIEPNMSIGDVLQPYQADIRALKGAATISGVETILEDGMILTKFEQKELRQFTATQMYQFEQIDQVMTSQALYKIIMEKLIIPKMKENINWTAFNGTGGGVTTVGVAGDMVKTFTGYNKRFADAIAANKVTPLPTGAITSANIVAKVKLMCQAMPSWLRFKAGKIYMSKSNRQMYIDAMIVASTYTYTPQLGTDQFAIVPGYAKTIIGMDSMEGSNRIIIELDEYPSMIIPTDAAMPTMPSLRATGGQGSDIFTMYVYAPMRRAYGLTYYPVTFVNDQV